MLAYLIGGLDTHYGMRVTADEFEQAFVSMRKLSVADQSDLEGRILSNTGRRLGQSFQ